MREMNSLMHQEADSRDKRPTFRELEALHALIESRKTTSAATKLGVSQPAISRAIQQLEGRLGVKLFRREGGRLHATNDGVRYYEETRPIFQTLDRLGRDGVVAEREQSLSIIAPPTLAHHFLPPHVAAYAEAAPGARLQIEVGTTGDVISKVADGNFDIGISDSPGGHPSLIYEPFRRNYAHVAMPADHPLAARSEVGPLDLDGLPFVALTRRFPSRGALERILIEAGSKPNISVEVATSALAYELVRAGLGVALINPFPVASIRMDTSVVLRPFAPRISFETVFVRSVAQPPSRAARQFIELVRHNQAPDAFSDLIKGQA
jgi:DNA-binding transcriptional LysR family regulator